MAIVGPLRGNNQAVLPCEWPALTADVQGDAAFRFHRQVVSVQPWGLLRGANGHVCVVIRCLDVLDPSAQHQRGYPQRSASFPPPHGMVGNHGGIHSFSPIRIHISLLDAWEYQEISDEEMNEAKLFLEPFVQSEQHNLPGLGPMATGAILTWTTQHMRGEGHSECLDIQRAPPAAGSLGPSRSYDAYVQSLQDALHELLDGLRIRLGFFGT